MTAPNMDQNTAPDGALVIGSKFSQDVKGVDVIPRQTAAIGDIFRMAIDGFLFNLTHRVAATKATLQDGQNALIGRTELLKASQGHGTAVMAYNWNLPHNQWVVLPFETQLGPMKHVSVYTPKQYAGWLCLKAGGLWRIDAHLTAAGYTSSMTFLPVIYPPYFVTIVGYSPVLPVYIIEIVDKAGNLITSRQYDTANTVALEQSGFLQVNFPQSASFSHTFVLDDMPDEQAEGAEEHWVYARVSMKYVYTSSGAFNFAECSAKGGTKLSSLTASRWSRDTVNNIVAPTVPDGGTL